MTKSYYRSFALGVCATLLASAASAENFNIPGGALNEALDAFGKQAGVQLIYSDAAVKGVRSPGATGNLAPDVALLHLLSNTGFTEHSKAGAIIITRQTSSIADAPMNMAAAAAPSVSGAALETVTVTSSKIGGDVQNIPISITALSQEQLTTRQVAGGPDLVKEVPNLTFSKTNFTGYNIEIRGIGTQAISVTTDPAVAVAFNDIPFIRNHFFEQEFYDLSQAEVLRGPQGTLYGRNATAGVVNLVSAKPTDQFEAMVSADLGNFQNRRLEGMINIPVLDDRVDIRVAGEWTKRQGYSFNEITGSPIDGRDLWSGRATVGWTPTEHLKAYLVWEHFSEDDDRLRSGKQLCKRDPGPATLNGFPIESFGVNQQVDLLGLTYRDEFSQGCLPTSLYAPSAFEVPNGFSLPFIPALGIVGDLNPSVDPYKSTTQSTNLRVIESTINPLYRSKNDTLELNADYRVSPVLAFTSQTGFNRDFLFSTEDYNRFNTSPGLFIPSGPPVPYPFPTGGNGPGFAPSRGQVSADGVFCDPQLGCANRLVGEDLSEEHAWQLSQEFRLSSSFTGPLNFSIGGNYLHYETEENYYVFINALTLVSLVQLEKAAPAYIPNVTDNSHCLNGFHYPTPGDSGVLGCVYIDPNHIGSLNGNGHNYFVSKNPYTLNSYAGFGEVYYTLTSDLKLTGGLRWTDDQKHFLLIPSEVLVGGWGYPVAGAVDQEWNQLTGRAVANWTPKLAFTDQTLVYGSYSHGYKAGGANPPGATLLNYGAGDITNPIHPLTFKPEFVDAYELGTKNTTLDGALTLNGDVFFYNYKGYQISQIVDRTSVNLNFNATVKGGELEATYEPVPGLRFNFAGGYEDTRLDNGSQAIDLMDRTAGHVGWVVLKPDITQASNCILPEFVAGIKQGGHNGLLAQLGYTACEVAYQFHLDPITSLPYAENPTHQCNSPFPDPDGSCPQINDTGRIGDYVGFDPVSGDPNAPADVNNGLGPTPNNGEGFFKNLSGKELPNAPHFTISFSTEYTLPLSQDWVGTLHGDFYWQADSWARVFNDNPYDRIRGYTNLNLALIFTNQNGWQIMGYVKNIFDTTAITGDFLNSDDSGLTTNVFLTDPRLFGVRVTKNL